MQSEFMFQIIIFYLEFEMENFRGCQLHCGYNGPSNVSIQLVPSSQNSLSYSGAGLDSPRKFNSSAKNRSKYNHQQTLSEQLFSMKMAELQGNIQGNLLEKSKQDNLHEVNRSIMKSKQHLVSLCERSAIDDSSYTARKDSQLQWKKQGDNCTIDDSYQSRRVLKLRVLSENSSDKGVPMKFRQITQQGSTHGKSRSPSENLGFRTKFKAIADSTAFKKKIQGTIEENNNTRTPEKRTRQKSLKQYTPKKLSSMSPCRTRFQTIHSKPLKQNIFSHQQQKQNNQSLQIIAKKLHLTDRTNLTNCKSIRKTKKFPIEYNQNSQLFSIAWKNRNRHKNFDSCLPQRFLFA